MNQTYIAQKSLKIYIFHIGKGFIIIIIITIIYICKFIYFILKKNSFLNDENMDIFIDKIFKKNKEIKTLWFVILYLFLCLK